MSQRRPIQNERIMLITTNTQRRKPIFRDPACTRVAIETLYQVQQLHPFFLFGFVVMPDHCHVLVLVPEPESISKIMNVWKGCVSMNIGLGPIWQRRFHSRIPKDAWAALNYIRQNPVRARLTENPEDYPWSSACGKWDVTELGYWW